MQTVKRTDTLSPYFCEPQGALCGQSQQSRAPPIRSGVSAGQAARRDGRSWSFTVNVARRRARPGRRAEMPVLIRTAFDLNNESASRHTTTVGAVHRAAAQRLGDAPLPLASAGAISAGLFIRTFGALPCRLPIWGAGGCPINGCCDGLGCIAAGPLSSLPDPRLAFAAGPGSASSSEIHAAPLGGPIKTLRDRIACSTRSELNIAPTLNACAGLPSMETRATPCVPEV